MLGEEVVAALIIAVSSGSSWEVSVGSAGSAFGFEFPKRGAP
jgi:hypothetical protein